jgi:enoyl-CoA hydratase/carnithine racemase
MAPNAMKESKRLIRANREAITNHMKLEGKAFMAQLQSAEFMEAAAAFMQKRKPVF